MDKIIVHGGRPLEGEVEVSGAKNAALPILFASLLTPEPCVIRNLPDVADVRTSLRLLEQLGARVQRTDGGVRVEARRIENAEASYELVKTMRASFLVLGPLLARTGFARVSTPGGCAIGSRPVDIHLDAFAEMGARISIDHGYAQARAERLHGADIILEMPSVGATEHLMMVASLADGVTTILNAACEPEIVDLAEALGRMGACIEGAGEPRIRIEGVRHLGGMEMDVIPDRIEAGTFLIAAAMTGGDVTIHGARAEHLDALLQKLREGGAQIDGVPRGLRVRATRPPHAIHLRTQPFPGFPTDLQAQIMALASVAEGASVISETIFENRFMHVNELLRMGARIRLKGNTAVVTGVERLSGAPVMATDLRASVCLVLAGLVADNATEVRRVYHLDRGYERIEEKLSRLGAQIERLPGSGP